MVAVITDLHNFFFYKVFQKLDKPISNNADPPSWCIPLENCPERGFLGNRIIQAFSTCHHICTGSWLLGIMRRIRRLSSLSPSGKLPVRIDGNFRGVAWVDFCWVCISLASQNCQLCSARSMAVLSDALVITAPTLAPDQNPLLRSRETSGNVAKCRLFSQAF